VPTIRCMLRGRSRTAARGRMRSRMRQSAAKARSRTRQALLRLRQSCWSRRWQPWNGKMPCCMRHSTRLPYGSTMHEQRHRLPVKSAPCCSTCSKRCSTGMPASSKRPGVLLLRQNTPHGGTCAERIVTLLRKHPDGLSPVQTRYQLGVHKDLGPTMKAMAGRVPAPCG